MLPLAAARPPTGPHSPQRPYPRQGAPPQLTFSAHMNNSTTFSNTSMASTGGVYNSGTLPAVGSPRAQAMKMAQQQAQLNARTAAMNGMSAGSGSPHGSLNGFLHTQGRPPLSTVGQQGSGNNGYSRGAANMSPASLSTSNSLVGANNPGISSGGINGMRASPAGNHLSQMVPSPPAAAGNPRRAMIGSPGACNGMNSGIVNSHSNHSGAAYGGVIPGNRSNAAYGPHGAQSPHSAPRPAPYPQEHPVAYNSDNGGNAGAGSRHPSSKACGVPPPVARGPQPTCIDPTRLPNGQRIKKRIPSAQAHQGAFNGPNKMGGPNANRDRRASRFASMRQLPGGVPLVEGDLSETDSFAGDRKPKKKQLKTGPGANGFHVDAPPGKPADNGKRKIKTTEGNDDTWMRGLTYTTWVDSPLQSARGENGHYRRKPNNARRKRHGNKSGSSESLDTGSDGASGSSAGGMKVKKTFVEKLKSLFGS